MEKVMILSTPEDIAEGLEIFMKKREATTTPPDLEADKISRSKAAKLAGVSLPTFAKMVKKGVVKQHGFSRNSFFLRSEIIAALRREADKNQ